MTKSGSRRKYSKEFKLEAVRHAETYNGPVTEVARNLGINPNMLNRWVREYKSDSQYAFPGLGNLKEPDEKLRRLEKELADVKMERDILKKALAIFSKPSR